VRGLCSAQREMAAALINRSKPDDVSVRAVHLDGS
jgi:hypothetical protein